MRLFEAAHPKIETVAHQKCRVHREERAHAECNQSDEEWRGKVRGQRDSPHVGQPLRARLS